MRAGRDISFKIGLDEEGVRRVLRKEISTIAKVKGVPEAPLVAVLDKLGERHVPSAEIPARLAAAADELIRLRAELARLHDDRPEFASIRTRASALIDRGEFDAARAVLRSVLVVAAATVSRREFLPFSPKYRIEIRDHRWLLKIAPDGAAVFFVRGTATSDQNCPFVILYAQFDTTDDSWYVVDITQITTDGYWAAFVPVSRLILDVPLRILASLSDEPVPLGRVSSPPAAGNGKQSQVYVLRPS